MVMAHKYTMSQQLQRTNIKAEFISTFVGSVALLLKGSEGPKGSTLAGFLKKSSDVVLKGSLSLKGSPPNGSRWEKRPI